MGNFKMELTNQIADYYLPYLPDNYFFKASNEELDKITSGQFSKLPDADAKEVISKATDMFVAEKKERINEIVEQIDKYRNSEIPLKDLLDFSSRPAKLFNENQINEFKELLSGNIDKKEIADKLLCYNYKCEHIPQDRISLNLKNTPKNTLQVPVADEKTAIGKINFFWFDGNVGESITYTNKNDYLAAIKKEMDYNPDGFKFYTLSKDPELLKSADDIIYNAYGAENPHSLDWYKLEHKEILTIDKDSLSITKPINLAPAVPVDPYIKQLNEAENACLAAFIEHGKTDFKNFEIFYNDDFLLSGNFKLITENGNKIPEFDSLTLTDRITYKKTNCMPMLNKLNENNVDILKLSPSQLNDLFSKNSLNLTDIKDKELFTKSLTDKPFNFSITKVGGKMFGFTSKIMSAFSKINEAVMG